MGLFTVTYVTGVKETIEADTLTTDGTWARFAVGGQDVVVLPQTVVGRVNRERDVEPSGPVMGFRLLCAAVLGPPAALATVVGLYDGFAVPNLPARLLGLLLAGLGALAGAGLVALFSPGDRSMLTRATVGLLAVAGVFCLLLILQLAGGRVDRLLLVWVAWALLAGACVWWLARGGAKPRVPKPAQGFLAARSDRRPGPVLVHKPVRPSESRAWPERRGDPG